jgi:uncharacterized protein (TIGR00369 family)
MTAFQPQHPDFEEKVRQSFARQTVMKTIGAVMTRVAPGEVEIEMPFNPSLSQQHGFIHAGIITTIVDSACGYAALTLMPADAAVLTVEFKVNLLSPAEGEKMIARGRVTRAGRTITVCLGDVFALTAGREKLVATMLTTMIALRDRSNKYSGKSFAV